MAELISCVRCKQKLPGLEKAPFGSALGKKIHAEICQACWKAWLATQNQLINHYGLSTINPDHQNFLIENMQAFLFGAGKQAEIDTTLQGKVSY
jgi:Fe-S cluster biosynthesis and repair protein YggX